jgi:hypothetical protein
MVGGLKRAVGGIGLLDVGALRWTNTACHFGQNRRYVQTQILPLYMKVIHRGNRKI